MDSFELNKIAGAVLGTLMFVLGLGIVTDMLFENPPPAVPGYDLPQAEEASASGDGEPAKAVTPLPVLLAKADASRGERAIAKCKTCHSFEKGGPNKIGPNLYGVVGAKYGHIDGFAYSKAMKDHGGEWTFEALDEFLANPRKALPGTLMNFAGISREDERADILVWLNSQADAPQPLPAVEEEPAQDAAPEAAPAGESGAPEKEAPAKETPSQEAPAREAPAQQEAPAQDAPSQEKPGQADGE